MIAIDIFYEQLDHSNMDAVQHDEISDILRQASEIYRQKPDSSWARAFILESEALAFSKNFNEVQDSENPEKKHLEGISYKFSGVQTLEDGSEAPYHWPNIEDYNLADYKYLYNRYLNCKNLYAKSEYGSILFLEQQNPISRIQSFKGSLKEIWHNEFKESLAEAYFSLTKYYYRKATDKNEDKSYCIYFSNALKATLQIARICNLKILSNIYSYMYDAHTQWNFDNQGLMRVMYDITYWLVGYWNITKKYLSLEQLKAILDHNYTATQYLRKIDSRQVISFCDLNYRFEKKMAKNYHSWLIIKAQTFEKLADEFEKNGWPAYISHIESAIESYKAAGDEVNTARMQEVYQSKRGEFQMGTMATPIPQEFTNHVKTTVEDIIKLNDSNAVFFNIISGLILPPVEELKKTINEQFGKDIFLSMLTVNVKDKFGNVIKIYETEEERKEAMFWDHYGHFFQMGEWAIDRLFFRAWEEEILTYEKVIAFLETTWYNDSMNRSYNGIPITLQPINHLKSGINLLFHSLNEYKTGKPLDLTCAIDSLTLKVETILRLICEQIQIPTFKIVSKPGEQPVKMEKLMDDLLNDLNPEQKETGFYIEDFYYLRYLMTLKIGQNLRNRVAHGLLDPDEYNFETAVSLFSLLLRLSRYRFQTDNNNDKIN
jgi:hypothetical protein